MWLLLCVTITGGGDDGSSSEEESDSDELSSSDDDSDSAEGDKMDDSVCPPGCDQDLFDLACEMREKRMDIEELIAEEKKSLDLLKKEVEGLKKKLKVMDAGVKAALSDLQGFQVIGTHFILKINIAAHPLVCSLVNAAIILTLHCNSWRSCRS